MSYYYGRTVEQVLIMLRDNPALLDYQACEYLYKFLPAASKFIDVMPNANISCERKIMVDSELQVKELSEEIVKWYNKTNALNAIADVAKKSRMYGAAALYVATKDKSYNPSLIIDSATLKKGITFNAIPPIHFAGTKICQDPLSPDFLNVEGGVVINGADNKIEVGPHRCLFIQHKMPLVYQFNTATFSFTGASAFQNTLMLIYLLQKAYEAIDALFDLAGGLHHKDVRGIGDKMGNAGAMGGLYNTINKIKQTLKSKNVVSTTEKGDVKTLTINGANEINILFQLIRDQLSSCAPDIPYQMLLDSRMTNGFSDGGEDSKVVENFVQAYNDRSRYIYDFVDGFIIELAWSDELLTNLKEKYKMERPAWNDDIYNIREKLKATYKYTFKPFLRENKLDKAKAFNQMADGVAKVNQATLETTGGKEGVELVKLDTVLENMEIQD